LVNFTSDGKRAIDTAWKGLIQKGILIAKSFKSADNRFAWSYTVNLEKVSMLSPKKIVVNYTEIASKYGVSEDVARAITEEAIAQAMPTASIADIQIDPITIVEPTDKDKNEPTIAILTEKTQEMASKPTFEVQSMPFSVPEMASKPAFEVQSMPFSVPEMASKPAFEVQSMPFSMPDMNFNPFFEVQSMSIPILEISSKPIIEVPKTAIATSEILTKPIIEIPKTPISASEILTKPIIEIPKTPISASEILTKPTIEIPKTPISMIAMGSKPIIDSTIVSKPTHTPHEKRNEFAEALLNDKKLLDYLRAESPLFEVTSEIIIAFHKRLDMNQLEHPNYEKYAQHFRNWLPDFLKYKDVGNKIKAIKQNVVNVGNGSNEKCGSNITFNTLRKKLQNPQEDYMTYQGWVLKLSEITENLSPADITYKKEMVAVYKNGQLLQHYQEVKAKMDLLVRAN
jgi:hypothetical protein